MLPVGNADAARLGQLEVVAGLQPARRATLDALDASNIRVDGADFRPVLLATASLYEITAKGFGGAVAHIAQDGRVWLTR